MATERQSPDGDWLDAASDTPAFNIDPRATITRITLSLKATKA